MRRQFPELGKGAPAHQRTLDGQQRSSTVWLHAACLCSLGLFGCPVDERPLEPLRGVMFITGGGAGEGSAAGDGGTDEAPAGQGGQPETGGTGAAGSGGSQGGTTGGTAQGGSAGTGQGGSTGGLTTAGGSGGSSSGGGGAGGSGGSSSGGGAGFTGRCPDLDGNQILDCTESVLQNATFDEDDSQWATEPNLVLSWVDTDGLGRDDSGSLGVEDTLVADQEGSRMVGTRQCQPVTPSGVYHIFTQIFVPDEAPDTRAGIQLIPYDGPKCTGKALESETSNLTQGLSWQTADFLSYRTPDTAVSMVVRLISVKPFRQPPATVLFDNVLMRPD